MIAIFPFVDVVGIVCACFFRCVRAARRPMPIVYMLGLFVFRLRYARVELRFG